MSSDSLCEVCGIGFILPSLRCDHCNTLQKPVSHGIGAKVMLALSEKEATWLRAYVQNPHCEPEDESPEDSKMREAFFNGINEAMDSST